MLDNSRDSFSLSSHLLFFESRSFLSHSHLPFIHSVGSSYHHWSLLLSQCSHNPFVIDNMCSLLFLWPMTPFSPLSVCVSPLRPSDNVTTRCRYSIIIQAPPTTEDEANFCSQVHITPLKSLESSFVRPPLPPSSASFSPAQRAEPQQQPPTPHPAHTCAASRWNLREWKNFSLLLALSSKVEMIFQTILNA